MPNTSKHGKIILHLPIFLVLKNHSESNLQPFVFHDAIIGTTQKWMGPLWLNIKNCTTLLALKTELASGTPIVICSSNTKVDVAAKFGSCAWTIYAMQYLWQGEGSIPCTLDNNYSSQSKAFRILMALQFLALYQQSFNPVYLQTKSPCLY